MSALLFVCLPALAQDQPASSSRTSSPAESLETPAHPGEVATDSRSRELHLTPDASGVIPQEQVRELIRVAGQKYRENHKKERDYTYIGRDVENKLERNGETKSTETQTYEVLEIYGEQVSRLIEKDDKPLSEKDAAKEEERIQKIIDKRKNESESDRRKREEKEEQRREEARKFVSDIADAYDFKLVGSEVVDGRDSWVIAGEPRPDFHPRAKESAFLSKIRGRLWIDKNELQLAKLDIEVIDTVAFGWFLARFHKGSRLMFQQAPVNDEVWLPKRAAFKLDARVALVKGFNFDGESTFRDYKKFRTSAKIVGGGEVKQP